MNSITVNLVEPTTDPDLILVANEVSKTVRLAMEKATAHLSNKNEYPLPRKADSLERIFVKQLKTLPLAKQKVATERINFMLSDTKWRKKVYRNLATVDLKKNIEITEQIAKINENRVENIDTVKLSDLLFKNVSTRTKEHAISREVMGVDLLSLEINAIQCVDETGPEATVWNFGDPEHEGTNDHIALSGNYTNEVGTVLPINQIDLGSDFGDNQNRQTSIQICNFNLLDNVEVYPRTYFANLVIAEIDNGGFSDFIDTLYRELQKVTAKKIEELVATGLIEGGKIVGGVLGGPFGATLGAALGGFLAEKLAPVIAKVIADIFDWFKNVWSDDLYPVRTIRINVPHRGALFMPNNGVADGRSQEIGVNFKRDDGEYNLFCSWNIDWAYSRSNLVTVYGGSFFNNTQSKCFGVGKYDVDQLGIDNDSMVSVTVPEPLTAVLFEHWQWTGSRTVFHANDFGLLPSSFESKVSSLIVTDNIDDLKKYGATFFEHANYQGKKKTLGFGQYNLRDLGFDNKISSIKAKMPFFIEVFEQPNCQGKSMLISQDTPYVGDEWNDKISSIRIVNLLIPHGIGRIHSKYIVHDPVPINPLVTKLLEEHNLVERSKLPHLLQGILQIK